MKGDHEPALMEGREGDDVTVGRHRHLLVAGNQPLHRISPPVKKTVLDKALHACVGDVGAVPRLHGKQRQRSEDFLAMAEKRKLRIWGAGGGLAEATDPNNGGGKAKKARLQFGVPKHDRGARYL